MERQNQPQDFKLQTSGGRSARQELVRGIVILVLVVAGVAVWWYVLGQGKTSPASDAATQEIPLGVSLPSEQQAAPVKQVARTLSGVGQKATDKFQLNQGLVTFKLKHDGATGHFGVWLIDSQGNNVDLLANDVGVFDGSKAVRIPATGMYLLNVSASGAWSVVIE